MTQKHYQEHTGYSAKVQRLGLAALRDGRLKPGTVRAVDVFHDNDCAIFSGGVCDCDPDVLLRPDTPND